MVTGAELFLATICVCIPLVVNLLVLADIRHELHLFNNREESK